MNEVARLLGVSEQRVCAIEKLALQKLRVALARECPEYKLVYDVQNRAVGLREVTDQ
jgi:DNA-directed RNA polymerase sigma subunit (sigma70/sigma32)